MALNKWLPGFMLLISGYVSCSDAYKTALEENQKWVKELVAQDAVNKENEYGLTPLLQAIGITPQHDKLSAEERTQLSYETVQLLVNNKADIHLRSASNKTYPLGYAIFSHDTWNSTASPLVVRYLLENNANPSAVYDEQSNCSMMTIACDSKNAEILTTLLDHPSIDIHGKPNRGKNPVVYLMCGMKNKNQLPNLRKFLQLGADPNQEELYDFIKPETPTAKEAPLFKSSLLILDEHRQNCDALSRAIHTHSPISYDVSQLISSYCLVRPWEKKLNQALESYKDVQAAA